jgi:hypothetical protein
MYYTLPEISFRFCYAFPLYSTCVWYMFVEFVAFLLFWLVCLHCLVLCLICVSGSTKRADTPEEDGSNKFNKRTRNIWLNTKYWRNITWTKDLEPYSKSKGKRSIFLNQPSTLNDGQLGRNMLWNKQGGRNSESRRILIHRQSYTKTKKYQNFLQAHYSMFKISPLNSDLVESIASL